MQSSKSHQTASNAGVRISGRGGSGLAAVVFILGITLLSLGRFLADGQDAAPGTALTRLIGLGVTDIGGLVVLWWALSFCLAVSAELLRRGGSTDAARRVGALAPVFMRRTACLALGMNLAVLPAAQAATGLTSASSASSASEQINTVLEDAVLTPQWIPVESRHMLEPSWQPTTPLPGGGLLVKKSREGRSSPSATAQVETVVEPGDSLWTIAARHLDPHASDASVAEAWPRWYEANRSVIGEDPELLQPGQVLKAPSAAPSESK